MKVSDDVLKAGIDSAVNRVFSKLQESAKREFMAQNAEQIDKAKEIITKNIEGKDAVDDQGQSMDSAQSQSMDNAQSHNQRYPSRLKRVRISCDSESAVKLLRHRNRLNDYLDRLKREMAEIQPVTEVDLIHERSRLTARYSISRMPYIATKREKKLVNGLKGSWTHTASATYDKAQEIVMSAPKDIIESEDYDIELDNYLKTGEWRRHEAEGRDGEIDEDELELLEDDVIDTDEGYFALDEGEVEEINEIDKKEGTLEYSVNQINQKLLSRLYYEWTQTHADLQLIRIAMELCSPDARAYAEQMIFKKGKATSLFDAGRNEMSFLQGREHNEEVVAAMLYVIYLQSEVTRINRVQSVKLVKSVNILHGGEKEMRPLTFALLKQIAVGEVTIRPGHVWYDCFSQVSEDDAADERKYKAEEFLVNTFLDVNIQKIRGREQNRRDADNRPLSAIDEYHRCLEDKKAIQIKNLYVNGKARINAMNESNKHLNTEECYTLPSEILVMGIRALLQRVCGFQAEIIDFFEAEIDKLTEKQKMVLRQLYVEGKTYRELTNQDGKPLSKNSSTRWNKAGLEQIQERFCSK